MDRLYGNEEGEATKDITFEFEDGSQLKAHSCVLAVSQIDWFKALTKYHTDKTKVCKVGWPRDLFEIGLRCSYDLKTEATPLLLAQAARQFICPDIFKISIFWRNAKKSMTLEMEIEVAKVGASCAPLLDETLKFTYFRHLVEDVLKHANRNMVAKLILELTAEEGAWFINLMSIGLEMTSLTGEMKEIGNLFGPKSKYSKEVEVAILKNTSKIEGEYYWIGYYFTVTDFVRGGHWDGIEASKLLQEGAKIVSIIPLKVEVPGEKEYENDLDDIMMKLGEQGIDFQSQPNEALRVVGIPGPGVRLMMDDVLEPQLPRPQFQPNPPPGLGLTSPRGSPPQFQLKIIE